MPIVLYGTRDSQYSVAVLCALRFKKLAYRMVEPRSREDYRRFSPETGLLPVIEIDGERTSDSKRILDLLDVRFPEPPLVSSDARVAREQIRLESWISQTFSFYVTRWLRARFGAASAPGGAPGAFSALGLIGEDGKVRPEVYDASDGGPGPEFERRIDDLANFLGSRPFFYSDRPGRADFVVFGCLHPMYGDVYAGSRALLERWPALVAHCARVLDATGGFDTG